MTQKQLDYFIKDKSEKELIAQNFEYLNQGNYYYALQISEKLLEYKPESANYNYRHGFALLNSQSDYTKPQPYLEKAGKNIVKNFDAFSPKEEGAPLDALYHLARCLHLDEQLIKSKEKYNEFIDRAQKNSELIVLANKALAQIEVAKKAIKYPKNYKLSNLTEVINHSGPDYSAVVSLDGTALYFTSRRLRKDSTNFETDMREDGTNQFLEDIYVSFTDFDGEWGEPTMLDFCKPEENEATVAVSSDERRIYLYKDTEGNGDIFYSDFASNRFQEVQHYDNKDLNTEAWEPHVTVTPDGLQMYFSSDREGGFGGRDIYRVVKLPNGKWSQPINLGPEINGPWDEDSPFIAIDNKTLYYASNGEKSMGGFDIFLTVKDEDNQWSNPINLGYPLNSTGDDLYYTTTVDGLTGYLTSFRKGGVGEKDIYEIKNDYLNIENISILKGEIEVTNGDLPEDISVTVRCLNCGDSFDKIIFPRLRDGVFFSSLQPCREYELIFNYDKGETEFHREKVSTSCELKYDEIYRHILLTLDENGNPMVVVPEENKIESYCPITFKHYFGYNKNKLTPEKGEFKTFLDTIDKQFANGRNTIELNITSSASYVPTRSFDNNQVLAETRALKLKADLEKHFASKQYKDSVKIEIKNSSVNGPKYKRGTTNRIDLYGPHQFVTVRSTAYNCIEESAVLNSKDDELKDEVRTISTNNDEQSNSKSSENHINSQYVYHVVTGSFRRIDYAEGMVENLKAKGFEEANIIGKTKGLWIVSAGGNDSLADAKKILKTVKEKATNKAYIFNTSKN